MRFFTVILFLFATSEVSAQWTFDRDKLSVEGEVILSRIENYSSVPSDTMGLRFENLPKDYPLTVLRQNLTIEELVELTNHSNAIVRCYGFKALTMVSEPAAFSVISQHLHDTTVISTHHGCFGSDEFVGDFFVNVYRGFEAIAHDSANLARLDSILTFAPNNLAARSNAMSRLKPNERFYQKIRGIVVSEKNAGALVALAKFNKESDIDLILNTIVQPQWPYKRLPHLANLQAIRQFKHAAFLPFLESHVERVITAMPGNDCRFLYLVIAEYHNQAAHKLLSLPFQIQDPEIRSKHLATLSGVLLQDGHHMYNDLRRRLKKVNQ